MEIIYNLTIYPFEFLIEIIYMLFIRNEVGVKIIMIGIIINIVAIPLYNIADKWQKRESDLQKKFKPKLDEIKAVFKGDKRHMIVQTFYRINHYHPIYALRGLMGVFIQVPIFIAAYNFIGGLDAINGARSGVIANLAVPDGLLTISGVTINVLPIVMTIANIAASLIHTRNLTNKERVPLFVMAGLFLVLLYNAPSALLVYWTTTNIFSLIKNIVILFIEHIKKLCKYAHILGIAFIALLTITAILFNFAIIYMPKDTVIVVNSLLITSLIAAFFIVFPWNKIVLLDKNTFKIFISSVVFLYISAGFFIPTSLIASSPEEFEKPFMIITEIASKYAGLLLLYPILFYFIFGEKLKKIFTVCFVFASVYAVLNIFIFKGDYGFLEANMTFTSIKKLIPSVFENVLNIGTGAGLFVLVCLVIKKTKTTIPSNLIALSAIVLFIIGSLNLYTIDKSSHNLAEIRKNNDAMENKNNDIDKIMRISKNGRNVIVIFMDSVIAGFVPDILEREPSLKKSLDGFVWYSQSVSLGMSTIFSVSSIMGGYEYTATEMNKRKDESLRKKHNEAVLLLPHIFSDRNYISTIIYPTYAGWNWTADVSIFKNYKKVKAYEKAFQADAYVKDPTADKYSHIGQSFLRFSLFKTSPMFLRRSIYDAGKWLSPYNINPVSPNYKEYLYFKEFTNMIEMIDSGDTYTYFGNEMIHGVADFGSDYKAHIKNPPIDPKDTEKYGDLTQGMYGNTAFLIEIANIADYLKENGAYDNTKIIVVSDHAISIWTNNIFGDDFANARNFYTFLMVKDFASRGDIKENKTFMTTGDVVSISTSHLENVVNPFTGKSLYYDKSQGVYISQGGVNMSDHGKNMLNIKYTYYTKENIFDSNNWRVIKVDQK